MWSEDLDKKIRSAAESNDPAYDDKAWDKMESLLDKHLPQEKKRRKILFLFFMFLLTGSTVFFILQKTQQHSKTALQQTPASVTNQPTDQMPAINSDGSNLSSTTASTEKNTLQKTIQVPVSGNTASPSVTNQILSPENRLVKPSSLAVNAYSKQTRAIVKKNKTDQLKNKSVNADQPLRADTDSDLGPGNKPSANEPISDPGFPAKTVEPAQLPTIVTTSQTDTATKAMISNIDKDSAAVATAPAAIDKKKKPGVKTGKWGISISTGPDISSVGINKMGKWKMQLGVGLSYDLNRNWTIRTGFYASRKIYTADSNDYHPPYSFSTYYPNLLKIDANCMVYEIPLSVVYNFSSTAKHNWFASTGLSSYLMKKEDYDYTYKNSWGQVQYLKSSFKNKNTHLFSILHISGGYQYHITDRFSLSAEPYLKLPLGGVGFGKVKLNSGGLLFTATLKPFAGKK